jgi:hypothetical protein
MVTPVSADTGDSIRAAAPTMMSSRIMFHDPDGVFLACSDICKCIDIYNINVILTSFFLSRTLRNKWVRGICHLDHLPAELCFWGKKVKQGVLCQRIRASARIFAEV